MWPPCEAWVQEAGTRPSRPDDEKRPRLCAAFRKQRRRVCSRTARPRRLRVRLPSAARRRLAGFCARPLPALRSRRCPANTEARGPGLALKAEAKRRRACCWGARVRGRGANRGWGRGVPATPGPGAPRWRAGEAPLRPHVTFSCCLLPVVVTAKKVLPRHGAVTVEMVKHVPVVSGASGLTCTYGKESG